MAEKAKLALAQDLVEYGDLDNAYRVIDPFLRKDPNSPQWLTLMALIMLGSDKPTIGYQLAKRVTQIVPKDATGWLNLSLACKDLWRDREGLRSGERALKLSQNDEQLSMIHLNMAAILIDTGQFSEAQKHAEKAVAHNPGSSKATANLGFCQLAQRQWAEGWKNYRATIGCEWRPRQTYNDEPEWDGKGTGNIVLWADQGLGDVISFGSIIPDVLEWAKDNDSTIILEVDPRLTGLFKRSFPGAVVYGTRGAKELKWSKEHREVHYSLPIGQVGEYFRTSKESFPGKPYLAPDKDRALQWKALFESKGKPVIGIAWSGGIERTGARFRRVDLEQLRPILESVDAHWVSLQYRDASREIKAFTDKYPHIDLVQYKHGTLTNDYDDTVAMVSALDQVVAMHTTVIHAAGGLGVPTWVFVPQNSQWRYGAEGEDFVWADSVRILRQTKRGQWTDVIERTAEELNARFTGVRETAGKAARQGKLRSDRPKIRANGKSDHRQARDRLSA